jgi:hypothetical protein
MRLAQLAPDLPQIVLETVDGALQLDELLAMLEEQDDEDD